MWDLISEGSQLTDSQSLIGREVSPVRMVERVGFPAADSKGPCTSYFPSQKSKVQNGSRCLGLCTIYSVDRLYRTVVQLEEAKRQIEQGDVAYLRLGKILLDNAAGNVK
jgi:hypothetical protein